MKILIVAESDLIARSLALNFSEEILITDHEKALEVFLLEGPSHVVIFDADMDRGITTHKHIKDSSTVEVVIRCGYAKIDESNYVQVPFKIEELKKLL